MRKHFIKLLILFSILSIAAGTAEYNMIKLGNNVDTDQELVRVLKGYSDPPGLWHRAQVLGNADYAIFDLYSGMQNGDSVGGILSLRAYENVILSGLTHTEGKLALLILGYTPGISTTDLASGDYLQISHSASSDAIAFDYLNAGITTRWMTVSGNMDGATPNPKITFPASAGGGVKMQTGMTVSGDMDVTGNVKFSNDVAVNGGISYAHDYFIPVFTDFLSKINVRWAPWERLILAGGDIGAVTADANHPGVIRIKSHASNANSGAFIFWNNGNAILIGGGEIHENIFQVAYTSNTTVRMGYHDSQNSNNPTDGVYFEIEGTTLRGEASSGTSRTATGTTYTITQGTYYRARLEVELNANWVDFYLYEGATLQWSDSVNSNLPTAAGRGVFSNMNASNSAPGGSVRDLLYLDTAFCAIERQLVR